MTRRRRRRETNGRRPTMLGRRRVLALCAGSGVFITVASVGLVASINDRDHASRLPAREVEIAPPSASSATDPGRPPVIEANGQVDIGGPGIPANTGGWVEPSEPAAAPDAASGLAPWPREVPLAELTTPMLPGVPVSECASPASAEGRAMGDAIVAYLFTWDASKATFDTWVDPLRREWERTAGYYGGEGSDGKLGAYTFDDRLEWMQLTAADWQRYVDGQTSSEVRINAVTTMMSGRHNLRLIYTVTVTQERDDGLAISATHDVEVWLTAPCEHDDYGIAAASGDPVWDLTGLQLWDVRGWKMPEQ